MMSVDCGIRSSSTTSSRIDHPSRDRWSAETDSGSFPVSSAKCALASSTASDPDSRDRSGDRVSRSRDLTFSDILPPSALPLRIAQLLASLVVARLKQSLQQPLLHLIEPRVVNLPRLMTPL